MALSYHVLVRHKLSFFPVPAVDNPRLLLAKVSAYALAFASILWFRLRLVDFSPPTFQEGDNLFVFIQPTLLRAVNLSYLHFVHFWILLAPDWLCFDWAFACIQPINSFLDGRIILVVAFLSTLSCLVLTSVKRNDSKVLLFTSFLILPFLPASNLIFTVGFVIAERNLYLSVLGFAGIVVTGYRRLENRLRARRLKFWPKFFFVFTMSVFAAKSWARSKDWQSEIQLYSSGIRVCPGNAKVFYNIAKLSADAAAANDRSDPKRAQSLQAKAVALYSKALQLWPSYEQALNNLGNLYRQQGDNLEAKRLLSRALDIRPQFPACWMNLGVAQANLNEFAAAEFSYKTALRQRRAYPDCHYNLGTLYLRCLFNSFTFLCNFLCIYFTPTMLKGLFTRTMKLCCETD
jgi:hypothetical protein